MKEKIFNFHINLYLNDDLAGIKGKSKLKLQKDDCGATNINVSSETIGKIENWSNNDYKLPICETGIRKTCGFHIFPEFELLINALAKLNPKIKHKGEAFEFLVNFYMNSLGDQKREELLRLIKGELEW